MTYHGHHTHAQAHAGSSFFQAPNTYHHRHSQSHSHQHLHDQSHRDGDSDSVRSPGHADLNKRQTPVDPELGLNLDLEPVVVVQTISVLHLIDGNGLVVQTSTLLPDPIPAPATGASVVAAAQTNGAGVDLGASLAISLALDDPATSTISAPTPTLSGTATVSDSSPSGPTTTAETVHVTNSSSSSSTSTETILTSTPLTTSMGYPSFTAPYNSTNSEFRRSRHASRTCANEGEQLVNRHSLAMVRSFARFLQTPRHLLQPLRPYTPYPPMPPFKAP